MGYLYFWKHPNISFFQKWLGTLQVGAWCWMQLTLFYFMKTCPRETCQTCCQTQFQHPRELSTSSLLVTKDGRTCNGSGTIGALSNCCSSSTIRCPNSAVLPLHQGLDQAPRALRCLVRLRYHAHTHTHTCWTAVDPGVSCETSMSLLCCLPATASTSTSTPPPPPTPTHLPHDTCCDSIRWYPLLLLPFAILYPSP